MILFITGTPGTGKTPFSKLFKEQSPSILWISIGLVMMKNFTQALDEEKGYKILIYPHYCSKLDDIISCLDDKKICW